MQYQISGIHIDVGNALQTHVKGELSDTISKYAERPTDAQIIFSKIPDFKIIEVNELNQTSRGEGGFGSTGLK